MQLHPAVHALATTTAAASVTPPTDRPEPAFQRRVRTGARSYLQGYAVRRRQPRFRIA